MKERVKDLNHVRCMKGEAETVLIKDKDISCRWITYFEKLMNVENGWTEVLNDVHVKTELVNEVSADELRMAVRSLKNGRAVGPDEVWKSTSR